MTKFMSAKFKNSVLFKQYHTMNLKTSGLTMKYHTTNLKTSRLTVKVQLRQLIIVKHLISVILNFCS